MAYRYVATSVAGFVQQLAVAYVANGYWFYVKGWIPETKDPAKTDAKIIAQYGLDVSKWTRSRQKQAGHASVQYLRHGRFYVIVATHGEHPFFAAEGKQIRERRRSPRQKSPASSIFNLRMGRSCSARLSNSSSIILLLFL